MIMVGAAVQSEQVDTHDVEHKHEMSVRVTVHGLAVSLPGMVQSFVSGKRPLLL